MAGVVSLGSVNLDHVAFVDCRVREDLAERHAWFPAPGETRKVEELTDDFREYQWKLFTGGKGANQAVAARRAGVHTTFLGKVGTDYAANDVLSTLRDENVDVECVGTSDAPTGRAHVFVDGAGENYIVIVSGANGEVDVTYVSEHYDRILDADCLLLQNEVPLAPMEWLLDGLEDETDRPTVIVNPAPATNAHRLLSYDTVDYVTPNEAEYASLRSSLEEYGGIVVRTRGDEEVRVEGPAPFAVEPPAVDVVDSTGAGDVFNGYLAARLASGESLEDAVETATVAASLSVREESAQGSIPRLDDVFAFGLRG